MRLYDTARQEVASFEPGAGRGGTVTIYTCGITPYDAAHLGHAATYLAYDVLQRRLLDLGYKTRLVRNVTDVDDDMLRKARQIGVYYLDLAAEEMAIFSADMEALGLLPAASEPRATSAIPDILGFIGMVLANGHAYQAGGAVYFDVSSWPEFGAVSHYSRDKMLELARERGGNPDDPHKSDPLDFVLWQPSAPDEPAWNSMWGRAGPDGTSSARLWPCESWGRRSTCTGAALTWCSRTTSAKQRSRRRPPGSVSSVTGCTPGWSVTRAPRCRSRSATSFSCGIC